MQLLTFTVGAEEFAIDTRRIVEVLPLVPSRPLPRSPDYIRGVITHRGRLVPLVDLRRRLTDQPSRERLGTRIMVVEFAAVEGPADPVRVGLVAENVLSLCSSAEAVPSPGRLTMPHAPYLADLLRIDGRVLQVLDVRHVLPRDLLPPSTCAATPPGPLGHTEALP